MIESFRKIFALLSARERRRLILLMGMMFLMALFEVVGIAAVLPFLTILSDPNKVHQHAVLSVAYEKGGFESSQSFLIALGVAIFALIVFSLLVKILTLYAATRFGHMRKFTLGSRLLRTYLSQPFQWHLMRHSADLTKNILAEVDEVVERAVLPAVRIISYGLIVIFIIVLLIAADPVAALAVPVVIGASYSLIYLLSRRYLLQIGIERREANCDCYKITQECFGAINDIKMRGLERTVIGRFDDAAFRLASRLASGDALSALPRHALEALLIGGIMTVVLVKLATTGGDLAASLPIIGLYAFAGIRLFPAAQMVYRNVSLLRFGKPALDMLYHDLSQLPKEREGQLPSAGPTGGKIPLRSEITLDGVSYSYPDGGDRPAVDGVSLRIEANRTVALVGRTGSGKTTLANIVLGLLRPQEGQLTVDGTPIDSRNVAKWQAAIGYVPQEIFLADDTIRGNIAFGVAREDIDDGAVAQAARLAELHDFVTQELPRGYDTEVGEAGVRLSGGQRQRIGIARALFHDPDLLVLDEATSALDTLTERSVMSAVRSLSRRKTIIMIAHRLTTVRDCDMIVMVENGRVAATGRYDDLLEASPEFRALTGLASV